MYDSNLATEHDSAFLAMRQDFAVIQSDIRAIKWMLAGIGFGLLTVMLGVSALVMESFGFL